MRPGKTVITEAWLRKVTKDRDESTCGDYTDSQTRGLVLWIAKDFTVTFSIRMRLKGVKKRHQEPLEGGIWSPAFTLAQARDACAIRRGELRKDGLAPKVELKCLADAIPMYMDARKRGDKQASRKRTPLPSYWDEYIGAFEADGLVKEGRFMKVFAPLLGTHVHMLTRDNFVDSMNAYGEKWAAIKSKEWDEKVLRPMMVCAMPMLRWFTKRLGLSHAAIEDLVPEDYEADERYLLPGEWQACAPHIDKLKHDCGLFLRFVLLTCVRSEQALCMQWNECQWGGGYLKFTTDDGAEHDALIWTVPRDKEEGGMKARKTGSKRLANSVLLTGDTLVVLKRLRAIWEEGQKDAANAGYNGVFTKEMVNKWRTGRTAMQRWIEDEAGCETWDRMTLRHTHATYLTALGCPPALVSMSMTHTAPRQSVAAGKLFDAAPITTRYVGSLAAKRFMTNDPLATLAPWHLRLHKLIRDMERGNVHSEELMSIIESLRTDSDAVNMRAEYQLADKWVNVTPTKLAAVG